MTSHQILNLVIRVFLIAMIIAVIYVLFIA